MTWRSSVAFALSSEELLAQEAARDFARAEVLPLAAEIDKNHRFPLVGYRVAFRALGASDGKTVG